MKHSRRKPGFVATWAWRGALTAVSAIALFITSSSAQTSQTTQHKFSPEASFRSGEEIARRNEKMGMRGVIQGRVLLDNGKPAVGIFVMAHFKRHQSGMEGENYTVTDSQGRYRIHGLAANYGNQTGVPQDFYVEVSSGFDGNPYLPDPSRLVPLGKTRHHTAIHVDFTLHRAPVITIRARDARTGAPFPGLKVTAKPPTWYISEGVTDAKGEFRYVMQDFSATLGLEDLERRETGIRYAPGSTFQNEVRFAGVKDLHDVTMEVKIDTTSLPEPKLNPIAVFQGVVMDSEGKPVAGVSVRLVCQSETSTMNSDSGGGFAFVLSGTLPVGTDIRIEAEKDGAKALRTFHVGEKPPRFELRLERH